MLCCVVLCYFVLCGVLLFMLGFPVKGLCLRCFSTPNMEVAMLYSLMWAFVCIGHCVNVCGVCMVFLSCVPGTGIGCMYSF